MRQRSNAKCPCLREDVVATCSADTDAIRIPPHDHVVRFCLTDAHRRCDIFRRYVAMRLAAPPPLQSRRIHETDDEVTPMKVTTRMTRFPRRLAAIMSW